jgi:hypothetical protein
MGNPTSAMGEEKGSPEPHTEDMNGISMNGGVKIT